jgi:predicted TIM-barrel fold metal-dependent hydrolase
VDEMNVGPGASERATAADTFRRLYWDTAVSWRDPVLQLLRSVVGIDRVLFGTDFPYLRRDLAIGCRAQLGRTEALTDEDRGAVLGETALALFPRIASRVRARAPSATGNR